MKLQKPLITLLTRVGRLSFVLYLRRQIELVAWRRNFRVVTVSNSNLLKSKKVNSERKLRILIASNIGSSINTLTFDAVLGNALKSRGHEVKISICQGSFASCMVAEHQKYGEIEEFERDGVSKFCNSCKVLGTRLVNIAKLDLIPLKAPSEVQNIDGPISEVALSGAHRFLGVGSKELISQYPLVLKRFDLAERQYRDTLEKIIKGDSFDVVIAHHGIYVPQGVVSAVSRSAKTRLVTWSQAYRRGTFMLSWDDTYHKTLLSDSLPSDDLTLRQKRVIKSYLQSRDAGTNDWIHFGISTMKNSSDFDVSADKKLFALFTNVSWDAQLHYSSRVFVDMHEWILETVEWFFERPQLQLLIRIHPAENTGAIKSKDPVMNIIKSKFGRLPSNIKVIDSTEQISSYSVMEKADYGLIYGTKAGIELATMGKPVVAAGEAWIRNKGIAMEPKDKTEYFSMLTDLANGKAKLPRDMRKRALRLAYYYFFERMINVSSIKALDFYPYMRPALREDWETSDLGLLSIVQSIENNLEFKYSA